MILLDLIQNLALMVALAATYRVLTPRWDEDSLRRRLVSGLLFGSVALVGMMTPVRLLPGLIFDGRSIVMGVAGFAGGPIVALVAGLLAGAYRVWLGGVGVLVGVAVVVEAGALGTGLHLWCKKTGRKPGWLALWGFGLAIHAVMAGLLWTLPGAARRMAGADVGVAILVVYPLVTMLLCRLFVDYEQHDRDRRALEESEGLYRTLWAGGGDAILATDAQGRVTHLNPVAEALTGWRADEAAGRPAAEVFVVVDEETGTPLASPLARVLAGEPPGELPPSAVLVARDGARRPVSDSCTPVRRAGGAVTGAVLAFRDQTAERAAARAVRESRERAGLALKGADLGTWDWNVRTGEVVVDQGWAAMLGYRLDEIEPHVRQWGSLVHPDDLPHVKEVLEAHLEGRTDQYETEHRERHSSGDWIWVLDRGRVTERDGEGHALRAAGTYLDITDRKRALEALRTREERLTEQTAVLLGLMAGGELFGTDLRGAVVRITEACSALAGTERVSVWWYSEDCASIRCWDLFERGAGRHSEGEELATADFPSYVASQRAGAVIATSDVRADPRTREIPGSYWDRHDIRSVVDAPVWVDNRVAGLLSFEHVGERRTWTPEDERLAATMSALVSLCVESTGRARAEASARGQLEALERMDAELRTSLDAAERARRALLSTLEDYQHSERALRESESFTRAVMDNLPIGVAVNSVDPSVEFTYMNDNFLAFYRTTRAALADPDAFWGAVYQDPPFREHFKARVLADVLSGDPERMHWEDVRITRTGEETTFVSARNAPVPGKRLMISTVWDVTDRKRAEEALRDSEERFRRALNHVPDVVVIYGPDLRIRYINEATQAMTGLAPDHFLGKREDELWPPEVYSAYLPALEEAAATGESRSVNAVVNLPGQEPRMLHILCLPLHNPDGTLREILGIARDLTQSRKAEAEIRALAEGLEMKVHERTRELSAANAELESFSYSVSHDLKAPLRAIDGYSAILEQGAAQMLDEDGRRLLREVRTNVQQMGRLIEDLLALSRVGRASLNLETVDPGPLVRDLVERERQLAPDRRIELVADGLPAVVGDPVLLRQALENLIGNAVKFTRPREVARIEVTAHHGEGVVEIAVRDNGVGFDPRYQHKLFRAFERLHYPNEFEGTGVGLAIVKRIAVRHGGRVTAESELGVGTVIRLTLPEA